MKSVIENRVPRNNQTMCFEFVHSLQVFSAYSKHIVSKDNCVYVGDIPKDWKLLDLCGFFHHYGPIISVKIMLYQNGSFKQQIVFLIITIKSDFCCLIFLGSSKGCGFVRFFKEDAAKIAIQHLGKKENNTFGLVVNISGDLYRKSKMEEKKAKMEAKKIPKVSTPKSQVLNGDFLVRVDGVGEEHQETLLGHFVALNVIKLEVSSFRMSH